MKRDLGSFLEIDCVFSVFFIHTKYFLFILGTIEIETASTVQKTKLPDFSIEYTRLCRDPCAACKIDFHKGEIRIMKVVYDTEQETTFGKATWYHVYCFACLRNELGWLRSAESLPGFSRLAEEDKESLLIQIP